LARRILLADDSVTAQNMGRRILHDAGYEVTTVNNGSAALKKIAELKPDLIILDVYMPGYGGLEVCSRLKENRETQRTPVLLTVGKLEPFKPEEARRVRADAYIVKPFEASELLTALTKLEDKIVPGPEPYKPGRFAKALAVIENNPAENDFGDRETGWKDRLVIPRGKPQADNTDPDPEPMPTKGFRSEAREEDFRPAEIKEFERPIPAGLPEDISPNEIEALAAAVAQISGDGAAEKIATPAPVEQIKSESAPEVVAAPTTDEVQPEVPSATLASAQVEESVAPAEIPAAPTPVVESTPARETETDAKESPEQEKRPANDAEVLAALASLTPGSGDFSVPSANQDYPTTVAESAVATVVASLTGPRWVAEAVALAEEDSSFLLEHEMEKTYAAFAAQEASRAQAVKADHAIEQNNVSAPVDARVEPLSAQTEPKPEQTATETVAAVAADVITPVADEAAYAAAASAGAATPNGISESHPVASVESTANSGGMEEGSVQRESELAAAWANWRQIRESIIGTEPIVAAPEAMAEEKTQSQEHADVSVEPAAEAMKTESSEAPAETENAAEISSIVDNMLAELKPKLMEELKRKLKK